MRLKSCPRDGFEEKPAPEGRDVPSHSIVPVAPRSCKRPNPPFSGEAKQKFVVRMFNFWGIEGSGSHADPIRVKTIGIQSINAASHPASTKEFRELEI